jgi:hypothetical protein
MSNSSAQQVGTYLVTPMTNLTASGQYMASVSVRRGAYDRIFSLIPLFDDATRALAYALSQGRRLVATGQLA